MAVTRKIDEFEIFEVVHWGDRSAYMTVRDPDDGLVATIVLTLPELKAISKELKAAIKELEGK